MSAKNKGNRKAWDSKQRIEGALLHLMAEKPFRDITVQELVMVAGVSRRTFHRNYSAKEEVIEQRFLRAWDAYREAVARSTDLSLPALAQLLFTAMAADAEFLSLVARQRLVHLCTREVEARLPYLFEQRRGTDPATESNNVAYALTFSTGGFVWVLARWLAEGASRSPADVAAAVRYFVTLATGATDPAREVMHQLPAVPRRQGGRMTE